MPDEPNNALGAPPPASPVQPPRPSWLPDGLNTPEEFRTRYDDTLKRLGDVEAVSKRWERWGNPDDFERNLATRLTERDKKLRADWEAEHSRAQAPNQPRDPFENWEMLDPRQQAAALSQAVAQSVLAQVNTEIENRWNQAKGQLTETDQRFNLLARALMDRTGNPDLDLTKLWTEANNLATGDVNKLYELAFDRAMAPHRAQKEIEKAVAAERQKWDQEQRNRDQAALTGPGGGTTTTSFKDNLAARQNGKGKESVRQKVFEKALAEGWLTPGQV